MNLGITPAFNSMNCKRNNSPSFGMAVKFDESALPVIKRQLVKLDKQKQDVFWKEITKSQKRQENNPVNIIVRKCDHRQALAADIIDSNAQTEVVLGSETQPFFLKNGKLGFLNKAEEKANGLNGLNERLETLPMAEEKDFYAGGIIPEQASDKGTGYCTDA